MGSHHCHPKVSKKKKLISKFFFFLLPLYISRALMPTVHEHHVQNMLAIFPLPKSLIRRRFAKKLKNFLGSCMLMSSTSTLCVCAVNVKVCLEKKRICMRLETHTHLVLLISLPHTLFRMFLVNFPTDTCLVRVLSSWIFVWRVLHEPWTWSTPDKP